MRRLKPSAAWMILFVLLAMIGAACSSADDDGGGTSVGAPEPAAERPAEDAGTLSDKSVGYSSGSEGRVLEETGQGGGAASSVPGIGPSVIKTADLRLRIAADGLNDALGRATDAATAAGGFIVSSTVDDDEKGRGSLIVRVPSDRFEEALSELSGLGDVDHKTVAGEDVTQEFIDLEARLRNAKAQEVVLLRLMDRSETIADTIRVQNQLTPLQLDIERLQGRIRYLEDRTSFGTIALSFVERGAPVPNVPNALERAWETAQNTALAIVSGLIIAAGALIPVALLGGLGYVVVMLVLRRLRPRFEP